MFFLVNFGCPANDHLRCLPGINDGPGSLGKAQTGDTTNIETLFELSLLDLLRCN